MGEPSDPSGPKFQLKKQLNGILQNRSLSAAELSRRSGVPKQVLSLWLAGVEPRKLSHLKRVADTLGLSIDELCFGTATDQEWLEGVFEGRVRKIHFIKE